MSLTNSIVNSIVSGEGFDPSDIEGYSRNYNPISANVSHTANDVSQLRDTASGAHLNQAISSARPLWDGVSKITFDGTTDYLLNMNPILSMGKTTTFIVGRYVNTGNALMSERDSTDGGNLYFAPFGISSTSAHFLRNDAGVLSNEAYTGTWKDANRKVIVNIETDTAMIKRVNGSQNSSNPFTRTGSYTPDMFSFGANFNGSSADRFTPFELERMIIYNRELTTSEIEQVEDYLNSEYGVY